MATTVAEARTLLGYALTAVQRAAAALEGAAEPALAELAPLQQVAGEVASHAQGLSNRALAFADSIAAGAPKPL